MELYPRNKLSIAEVRKFIVIFYIVGITGFIIPFTKETFVFITPFALILNIYLLAIYHRTYTAKSVFIFLLILLAGFIIEVAGVNSGLFFGSYNYGKALGMKLFDTPLLIGFNWLFLTYTTVSVVGNFKIKDGLIVFAAPLLMLFFDFFLEHAAPKTDMWYWQNSVVPLKNYITWYITGVVFTSLFVVFKIDTKNPMAVVLFVSQFVFFVLLTFLLE